MAAGTVTTQQPNKAEVSSSFIRHEDNLDELVRVQLYVCIIYEIVRTELLMPS